MRPFRLLKITETFTLSRWRRSRAAGYGPRRRWRRARLATAAIVVAATALAAAPAVAGAATAHHSLADNGVIHGN
jgi:hypothetical protein